MILRATVSIAVLPEDTSLAADPFPRAVLQREAENPIAFRQSVEQEVQAKFARRRLGVSVGPIGIPWSQQ